MAQWDPDPTENTRIAGGGTPVQLVSVEDPGGIVSFWTLPVTQDSINILGQRTDSLGNNHWGPNGKWIAYISNDYFKVYGPMALTKGNDAFLFWVDVKDSGDYIKCMPLDTLGDEKWPQSISVGRIAGNYLNPMLYVADSDSSVMWVSWLDAQERININTIDTAGSIGFASPIIVDTSKWSSPYKMISSHRSSIVVLFNRASKTIPITREGIFLQKYTISGTQSWTYGGIEISGDASIGSRFDVVAVSDSVLLVCWAESSSTGYRVMYQLVSAAGIPLLDSAGVEIAWHSDIDQIKATLSSDGTVYITYCEDSVIYTSRISHAGQITWPLREIIVNGTYRNGSYAEAVALGTSDLVVGWLDSRNYQSLRTDVYAQRIDSNGVPLWMTGGNAVCTHEGFQYGLQAVKYGGQPILVWIDQRTGDQGVYASMLRANGKLMPVTLSALSGICTENGVQIVWTSLEETNLLAYHIERLIQSGSWEAWLECGSLLPYDGVGEKTYNYKDNRPINREGASYAYRLRLEYYDGSSEYYPVGILGNCEEGGGDGLMAYPNPTIDGKIFIKYEYSLYRDIYVCDILGRRLFDLSSLSNIICDPSVCTAILNLESGIYYIVAVGNISYNVQKLSVLRR
jgi:hypothetical protein